VTLGPRSQQQYQAEIALRADGGLGTRVGLVPQTLDVMTKRHQPIFVFDLLGYRREHVGDEHIPVSCRAQLADQPFQLAADVFALLDRNEFIVQGEARAEPAGRHPHLVNAFLVFARKHATLVAAQMLDAAENDLDQRRLRGGRGGECRQLRLAPADFRLVPGRARVVACLAIG
jgi:hypothetical protein